MSKTQNAKFVIEPEIMQARSRLEERKLIRLAQTRDRLRRREFGHLVRRNTPKKIRLSIVLPETEKIRAERACLAVDGIELTAMVRLIVKSYADMADADLPRPGEKVTVAEAARSRFLEQDQEFADLIVEYVAELPVGSLISVADLFEMMDLPPLARNRPAEMSVGRIMRKLGWPRQRVLRGDLRSWFYRKPHQERQQ